MRCVRGRRTFTAQLAARPLVSAGGGVPASAADPVTDRHSLRPLLAALTVLQQRMLALRFFDDLTQTEIAAQLGVKQMQISRLLVATLDGIAACRLRVDHMDPPGMLAEPSAVPLGE